MAADDSKTSFDGNSPAERLDAGSIHGMKKPYPSKLNRTQRLFCFAIGIILACMIVFSAGLLLYLAGSPVCITQLLTEQIHKVMLWSCIGGFLGGSTRALFTFKHEMAGWGDLLNSEHIKNWFIYLVKPFIGIAGGLFFFLLVNLGIVGLYAGPVDSSASLDFSKVALTSVIGGMYFENVFAFLLGMVPSRDSSTNDENGDRR